MTLTDSDVSERPVDVRPILLPQAGDGQRRRRRYERQRVVRQRWLAGGSVIVAAIAAVLLLRGTHTGKQRVTTTQPTTAASQPANPSAATTPGVAPPSVLIQQVNNGHTSSIAAVLPSVDGAGGTVLVFPSNTTLTAVATNLPRHKAETILALDDAALSRLFLRAGPLVVTVAGQSSTVSPEQVPAFFTTGGPGDPLARQRAYWEAWLGRMHDDANAVPTQAGLAPALQILVKGPWTVAVPPGTTGG
jgi:hypothetical protein